MSAPDWISELEVSNDEILQVAKRLTGRKAPGPDGIIGGILKLAMGELAPVVGSLMTDCLQTGQFPDRWKRAILVLLPKEGKPADSPSAYRLICLLDELAKLLERIIIQRIIQHLTIVGPDLSPDQYGFRRGRSTIDAILSVRSRTEAIVQRGGVALAVSLDITNAFNTVLLHAIGSALVAYDIPPYLITIIRGYFQNRKFMYYDRDERLCEREVKAGVPQESVLGPLLWDLAYDCVLRAALPPGATVVGYADDTIVVVGGET